VCSNQTLCAGVEASTDVMMDKLASDRLRARILDNQTHYDPGWYGAQFGDASSAGTTHVSVVDSMNTAAAVTSTVNLNFGAKIMTPHGIILNNQMDDFSSPNMRNAFGCVLCG
jgi:gamma-glutamyltranspeptidase/glutathione hydrolase/leukotriene-C4 hydrolase